MPIGAHEFQKILRQELEKYILTQYFGKSMVLREAIAQRIDDEGRLYQKPYIESSPAYKSVPNGIAKANIPTWLKTMFQDLSEARLGVYPAPFLHQIQALENAIAGKDLFVATGTGSGKTECFMWPLVSKVASEAHDNEKSWRKRGVRAVIMYPMNALVSDQVSRLRRLLGDGNGKFLDIFRKHCGNKRRPQFGMYTGRTPYPGKNTQKTQDKALANTLKEFLPNEQNRKYLEKLQKEGKVPAKKDLQKFIENLKVNKHITHVDDAELITRFEMQACTPDILITNYSMLEYMLIRPIEAKIWDDTKAWLQECSQNKLLFIIDEAHMYRGASGGEVALLLRRLFYRLGVQRDKVQFILTTASMPKSDQKYVEDFAKDLTAAEDFSSFSYLTGEQEVVNTERKKDILSRAFEQISIDALESISDQQVKELNKFWQATDSKVPLFMNMSEAELWLYQNLMSYHPFCQLVKQCRGTAVSLNELADKIFPKDAHEKGLEKVSILLAIAPLARNTDGTVLFPARMHMLFRGINSVYACVNPHCSHAHSDGALTLGEIFLDDKNYTCPYCGSVVYELYNDRRCGALFFHGYCLEDDMQQNQKAYLWRHPGQILEDNKIKEVNLYIPPKRFSLHEREKKGNATTEVRPCYLDMQSGFISFFDDSWDGRENVLKLYYSINKDKGRPDAYTFSTCPHCESQLRKKPLASFSTRGNVSFFNLIKAQFELQPSVKGKENTDIYPNEGRKVLLFSDSRQRAAKLARDMTEASDLGVLRKLFTLAIKKMMTENEEISLDDIYGYFCYHAIERNVLQLFMGQSKEKFKEQCRKKKSKIERYKKRNREYIEKTSLQSAPQDFATYLLRLYCAGYNAFTDFAISWLAPMEDEMYDALDMLEDKGHPINEEDFIELFNAWMIMVCDYVAIGDNIQDEIRRTVQRGHNGGYGLPKDWKFNSVIRNIMEWDKDHLNEMYVYVNVFQDTFMESSNDTGNYYVRTNTIKPMYDVQHPWFKCEKCASITPYKLREHCPHCGSLDIHEMTDSDYEALRFLRDPIEDALSGSGIKVIDTEEHTAQLSHKDQRDNLWSKTESYEMRFQDLVSDNEQPVDILSSTTTMEVGIDIGSLVAVGLRNIPPMRENYQQRAGRAGRRGASLSTIVTFCEDGPHDSLYFKNPVPMFRGDPRRPWIDISSEKLLERHVDMIVIQDYLKTKYDGIDCLDSLYSIAAFNFMKVYYEDFCQYLLKYELDKNTVLLPQNAAIPIKWKDNLLHKMRQLKEKIDHHPDLYGEISNGELQKTAKSLLDALYEEGDIPTYSFPKNVVSTYIFNANNKVEYQVERGLDVAISEYAPGRAIVVDKQIYQIGGFYTPITSYGCNFKAPARKYVEDKNYRKERYVCDNCGWFGLEEEKVCPFCGSESVRQDIPLLKPWGFAPKNGTAIENVQLDEEFSMALPPLYSTLPNAEEMVKLPSCKNMRLATRSNQRIIMLNKGPNNHGFMVCKDCGAAMPGRTSVVLNGVKRPYKSSIPCKHSDCENVSLGYDFVTDMLVLEIYLDSDIINTEIKNNLWLTRAGQTLAEALRIAISQDLDIEYTELIAGHRVRRNKSGTYVDIYLYDSLSSGAGYAIRVKDNILELLHQTKELLDSCNCDAACHRCLKHYRNQMVHNLLDRYAAKELLSWATDGILHDQLEMEKQEKLIRSLSYILQNDGIQVDFTKKPILLTGHGKIINITVYPGMCKEKQAPNFIFVSDTMIKYAKPYALKKILSKF